MKERLIEIFKNIEYTSFPDMTIKANLANQFTDYALNHIVDKILANGVIVPPYKVGTKVFVITSQTSNDKNYYIFEDRITHYVVSNVCTTMCFANHISEAHWNWGNVFLTKEEAEKALAERIKNEKV